LNPLSDVLGERGGARLGRGEPKAFWLWLVFTKGDRSRWRKRVEERKGLILRRPPARQERLPFPLEGRGRRRDNRSSRRGYRHSPTIGKKKKEDNSIARVGKKKKKQAKKQHEKERGKSKGGGESSRLSHFVDRRIAPSVCEREISLEERRSNSSRPPPSQVDLRGNSDQTSLSVKGEGEPLPW